MKTTAKAPAGFATKMGFLIFVSIMSLILWAACVKFMSPARGITLSWDEVDYVNAAHLGITANALEQGSLSPREFFKFSVAKLIHKAPPIPVAYDEAQDPFLLRHLHPPLVIYLETFLTKSSNEAVLRSGQLLGALALIFAIFVSFGILAKSFDWLGYLAVSALPICIIPVGLGILHFHIWEAVWATVAALCTAVWLGNPANNRIGVLLCLSLALALVTLESGFFICAAVLICLFVCLRLFPRDDSPVPWRRLAWGAGLTIGLVVTFWPGSVYRVSLLKNVAYNSYQFMLSQDAGAAGGLIQKVGPLFVIFTLVFVRLVWFLREDFPRWGPFFLIGAIYGLAMIGFTRFTLASIHLLPAVAPLICLVGFALEGVGKKLRLAVVSLCFVALAWTLSLNWPEDFKDPARTDLQWLGGIMRDRETWADGAHIYRYYLGETYALRPVTLDSGGRTFFTREKGANRILTKEDVLGKLVVIQSYRQQRIKASLEKELLGRCSRRIRPTIVVFDCAR